MPGSRSNVFLYIIKNNFRIWEMGSLIAEWWVSKPAIQVLIGKVFGLLGRDLVRLALIFQLQSSPRNHPETHLVASF